MRELNEDRILSEIERALQSYAQFVLDEALEIELTHAKLPTGGVGKRCHYVALQKMMKDKRCFIRIANQDHLCCQDFFYHISQFHRLTCTLQPQLCEKKTTCKYL